VQTLEKIPMVTVGGGEIIRGIKKVEKFER
jgi:hypothetical protein